MDRNTIKVTTTIIQYTWTNSVNNTNNPAINRQTEITLFSPNRFNIQPNKVNCTTAPEIDPKVMIKAISLGVKPNL
ncbi:hypothetical protein D3C80_1699260 [compost metagenome]